jgi:uncharacterized protein YraI
MKRTRHVWVVLLLLIGLFALLPGLAVRADFGVNWSATFFPSADLTGTGVPVAGINGINFNWGSGPPVINGVAVPGMPVDNFSARFTSTQTFSAGTYQFVAASDDGIRVYIDGALVLDRFVGRALTTDTFTQTLTAGIHNLTVEYFEGIDQAIVQFQWFLQGADTGTVIAPTSAFTPVPALSVQVVNVRGLSVRTGPYLGASLITVARPGTPYTPIARNTDEGQYTWYLIQVGDKTGWASGRYLQVTGDPNTIPVRGTIFDQIDNAPNVGVVAIPRSVMNFRRRPSQRAALIGQIAWGAETELIGRTIQGGNNFWFQVRYNGQVGWIYAPFVSTRGNINAVPIY